MANSNPAKFGTVIPVSAYPQPLQGSAKELFTQALASRQTAKRAEQAFAESSDAVREAVIGYVAKLEAAQSACDRDELYAEAHEIRGLAANAGLVSAGRLSDGLCRYLDEIGRMNGKVDIAVVALYVGSIARASRATDDATKLGDTVAQELNKLAARRLAEWKDKVKN
jgi:hypothetical protein